MSAGAYVSNYNSALASYHVVCIQN
jgi:hypothetical protein